MNKFIVTVSLAMAIAIVSAHEEFTEDEKKNIKMIFCGNCKDESMQPTLEEFGKCVKDAFPDKVEEGMKIKEKHKDDLDGCWTEMQEFLGKLHDEDHDKFQNIPDCFNKHIPDKSKLETCH